MGLGGSGGVLDEAAAPPKSMNLVGLGGLGTTENSALALWVGNYYCWNLFEHFWEMITIKIR